LQDTPITIDSDDEEQPQQGPGAAAGDVEHMTLSSDGEDPSGGRARRRRSSRINLVDPEPGTAAKYAVSGAVRLDSSCAMHCSGCYAGVL
jgi:hypothetical protein